MARGGKREGAGRPKGTSNKATLEFKEAVNKLIDYATPEMVDWLRLVAQEDPSKALDHVYKFAQFGYPLLSRSQLTGKDDGPIEIENILKDVSRLEKDQGLQSNQENIKIDTDLIFNEEI